jgi:hypothetical protein
MSYLLPLISLAYRAGGCIAISNPAPLKDLADGTSHDLEHDLEHDHVDNPFRLCC